jgi:hypothetical protein
MRNMRACEVRGMGPLKMIIIYALCLILGMLLAAGGLGWLKRMRSLVARRPSADTSRRPSQLADLKRPAWVPITEDGDGDLTSSKFAGIPWLAKDEDWPICPNCERPRELLLQLDLATLPARPEGCPEKGLLQLFYCTNGDDECESQLAGWDAFSENTFVRIVSAAGPGRSFDRSPVEDPCAPKRIVGWQCRDDYPDSSEASELGIPLPVTSHQEVDGAARRETPIEGDKLMGWPKWVQDVEYPECPECRQRMSYLFQIDSEHNLPLMFGDMGIGHITFCPKHTNQIAFAWACY